MFGFLSSSKRVEYEETVLHFKIKYLKTLQELNALIKIINNKGGQMFLDNGVLLTPEEVRSMIVLCHPDKHDGKPAATKVTQRLLQIKKQLEKR